MESAEYFREKATHCRRLAAMITDKPAITNLLALALEFDTRAVAVDAESAASRGMSDSEGPAEKPNGDGAGMKP